MKKFIILAFLFLAGTMCVSMASAKEEPVRIEVDVGYEHPENVIFPEVAVYTAFTNLPEHSFLFQEFQAELLRPADQPDIDKNDRWRVIRYGEDNYLHKATPISANANKVKTVLRC